VTLATHEHFAESARESGLEFCSLVSNQQTEALLRNADFWHPVKGPITVARWGAPLLQAHYGALAKIATEGDAVLVANPGLVAARLVNEKQGVPLISIVLQPWMILSSIAPPTMMAGLTLPRWAPPFIKALYWWSFDIVGRSLLVRELGQVRASLGLKKVKRMFHWWLSPDLVIGMFPNWYANPQADWPAQLKLAGFPLDDVAPSAALDSGLVDFCSGGEPCVAFTFGTGMMHADKLFATGLEVCRQLGTRALFITRFASQLPTNLPASVRHVSFASFQQLFPLCRAVVHHGGIGTTAKALAAGVPQLIIPFAFDQLDNALRVQRLGAGDWLPRNKRSVRPMANCLRDLLLPEAREAAVAVAKRFEEGGGLQQAAGFVENFASRKNL